MSVFDEKSERREGKPDQFFETEVRLANRNSGFMLEMLSEDITPLGGHYLLNHFDVPIISKHTHVLDFGGAFENSFSIPIDELKQLPSQKMPVTLECAGNGRSLLEPRNSSMPWFYDAVGTAEWIGTPLAPLLEKAKPKATTQDFVFTGADHGFDKGVEHTYERSLTPREIAELDVMLIYGMNDGDLLPQHGAPLRLLVPGWYGMASVKWLTSITAITHKFEGFQQVGTYKFRRDENDEGTFVQDLRVKSLIRPPGIPDWSTRNRLVEPGHNLLMGRAWSGLGRRITKVEVSIDGVWQTAILENPVGPYAWTKWTCDWTAVAGTKVELSCRATDEAGNIQPLDNQWDFAGFGNNVVHRLQIHVRS